MMPAGAASQSTSSERFLNSCTTWFVVLRAQSHSARRGLTTACAISSPATSAPATMNIDTVVCRTERAWCPDM